MALFDQCLKAKNPLMAFVTAIMVAVKETYTIDPMTHEIEFTADAVMLGSPLDVINTQGKKVKYTPSKQAMSEFFRKWLSGANSDPKFSADDLAEVDNDNDNGNQ